MKEQDQIKKILINKGLNTTQDNLRALEELKGLLKLPKEVKEVVETLEKKLTIEKTEVRKILKEFNDVGITIKCQTNKKTTLVLHYSISSQLVAGKIEDTAKNIYDEGMKFFKKHF